MDFSSLARLAGAHAEARIIQTAVSLGLFDALEHESLTVAALAATLKLDRRAVSLFLNALVALGLLEQQKDRFALTRVSATYLLRSSEKYFGGMVRFEAALWDCWRDLEESIRSGRSARPPDMYQNDAQETERFIYAMHSLVEARGDAEILTDTLDLDRVRELLDVGSGPGTYPIHFCRKYPNLRATIFDLPATLRVTQSLVHASDVKERIRLLTGDYRGDAIPGKYQMAFLCNIIHGESAETNAALAAKIYAALEGGGTIVIKDHILDDTLAHPPVGAIFSLLMLLTTENGRCYSFNEVRRWLEAAAFKEIRQVPLPHPLTSSLVIGVKD